MTATATETKPAAAPAAPVTLTKAQTKEATALRQGDPAKGVDGLTFAEIATRLSVPAGLISKALAGMPVGKVKTPGTVTPHTRKVSGSVDWDSAVASVAKLSGAVIAWRRGEYVMVRGDDGASGARVAIAGTGTTWATMCHHLTIKPVGKGGAAEIAGKERTTWCASCAKGEPGVVAKREVVKAEGDSPAKAGAKKETASATSLAGSPAAKERAAKSGAARKAEKAAREKAAREAAAALATDEPLASIA